MQEKKHSKFYLASMMALGGVLFVVLVLSLCHIKNESVFDGWLTGLALGLTGLLTAVCLCMETANGRFFYKLGFFLLHGGIVVLMVGFLISRFFCAGWTVAVPVGEHSYRYVVDEATGGQLDLGFYLGVTETQTEYYTDADGRETANPKHYEATVVTTDLQSLTESKRSLTVNHPLRMHGSKNFKVYLMSLYTEEMTGKDQAVLYLKADPAEYTILTGIVLLITGSICMCLLGELSLRKTEVDRDA